MIQKNKFLFVILIFSANMTFSQKFNVLEFSSPQLLADNKIHRIYVNTEFLNSETEDNKGLHEELFMNEKGLLDSSFRYAFWDTTNRIVEFEKIIYNKDDKVIRSISGREWVVNVDYDRELKETITDYFYDSAGHLIKEIERGETGKYDLTTYEYIQERITKRYAINTSENDTLSTIEYIYSAEDNLVIEIFRVKGEMEHFIFYQYDEKDNLIQKHKKKPQIGDRHYYEDHYFKYDSENNLLERKTFMGTNDNPNVYSYEYNKKGLLIYHDNPWSKETIIYE